MDILTIFFMSRSFSLIERDPSAEGRVNIIDI